MCNRTIDIPFKDLSILVKILFSNRLYFEKTNQYIILLRALLIRTVMSTLPFWFSFHICNTFLYRPSKTKQLFSINTFYLQFNGFVLSTESPKQIDPVRTKQQHAAAYKMCDDVFRYPDGQKTSSTYHGKVVCHQHAQHPSTRLHAGLYASGPLQTARRWPLQRLRWHPAGAKTFVHSNRWFFLSDSSLVFFWWF